MGTALIYDWDFFHYPNVMPNLECMKYSAYMKKKRQITTFKPTFEPQKYTKAFFRKDYDDGIYDRSILLNNVEYGGRAFSNIYKPNNLEFEKIEPDVDIYANYKNYYIINKKDEIDLKTILNATHVRISLDGKNMDPFPYDRLQPRHPCIIFHDYDLGSIINILDLMYELNSIREKPYRIGNKFPINVYNYQDLQKWLKVAPMGCSFCLQYNGIFSDEEIIDLTEQPNFQLQRIIYNFTYNCLSEEDFIQNVLSKLYKQILYLRRNNKKILLNIDTIFFETKELINLMILLYDFLKNKTSLQVRPRERTLYGYCASQKLINLSLSGYFHYSISREDMRGAFQYIRKHNYEVFCMFYDIYGIIAKGGKLINER